MDYLDFEEPLIALNAKINELRKLSDNEDITNPNRIDISDELKRLEAKSHKLLTSIYSTLSPWQTSKVARHMQRPQMLDYTSLIFEDFQELHGDRMYADDRAIIGGCALFHGRSVMVIGHQKGRNTREKMEYNFGMPKPEGYRKALRLMRLAEKFNMPILTFVDTPGAYPGIGAEERGQSESIARNLFEMSRLNVPVITTIIGEGGSGGALAIAICDMLLMMQHATYSVISPEGCASILWRNADKAPDAAEALNLTAERLQKLGIVDRIVDEPLGGAHRHPRAVADTLSRMLQQALADVEEEVTSARQLRQRRSERYSQYGIYEE